jgi:hypothetical protein
VVVVHITLRRVILAVLAAVARVDLARVAMVVREHPAKDLQAATSPDRA